MGVKLFHCPHTPLDIPPPPSNTALLWLALIALIIEGDEEALRCNDHCMRGNSMSRVAGAYLDRSFFWSPEFHQRWTARLVAEKLNT